MEILRKLETALEKNSNQKYALEMKRYMRNKFEFYGVKAPLRYEIFKEVLKTNPIERTDQLVSISKASMKKKERDFHHFSIYIWEKNKKLWSDRQMELFGWIIDMNSWWDTADYLINKVISPYVLLYQNERKILDQQWNNSDSVWRIRASILYQLKFKSGTDEKTLTKAILNQKKHQDFFVQKAIGWILREYSKTRPNFVKDFVKGHDLSPLANREAIKWLVSKNQV